METVNPKLDQGLDVELPFRVEAGPGSGKTRWLAEHVRRTLATGTKLNVRARVACITYTQIGTDTLKRRLGKHGDQVWISTIHSFLYHQVVRPYAHHLGIPGLNTAALDGHAPLRPHSTAAKVWLEALGMNSGYWYSMDLARTLAPNLEKGLAWSRQTDGSWTLGFAKRAQWKNILYPRQDPKKYYNKHEPLLAYKKNYWADGRIDHDDVVYMAHRLLTEHPELRSHITDRFPYIFLDEYQDTTTAQADIVDHLTTAGAVVGVIGDIGQAIFSFTGADPECYRRFSPPNCQVHTLHGNWRSTAPIVRVLNHYRFDRLQQVSCQVATAAGFEAPSPCVIVGTLADAYAEASQRVAKESIHLIGRGHAQVGELGRVATGRVSSATPWDAIETADLKRANFLRVLCRAARHTEEGRHHDAIQEFAALRSAGGHVLDPLTGGTLQRLQFRSLAVVLLGEFMRAVAGPSDTVLAAYRALDARLRREPIGMKLTNIKDGKFAKLAATTSIQDLVNAVEMDVPTKNARTIHAYKGDEAEAILLYVDGKKLLTQLHTPTDNEESRLLYVALSRARTHLFIAVPGFTPAFDEKLRSIGYMVVRLPSAQTNLGKSDDQDDEADSSDRPSEKKHESPAKRKSPGLAVKSSAKAKPSKEESDSPVQGSLF